MEKLYTNSNSQATWTEELRSTAGGILLARLEMCCSWNFLVQPTAENKDGS